MASAQHVFDIPKLLEIIICQVDAPQIHDLKLVNRSWRDMISTSKAVRRAQVVNSYHNRYWKPSKEPDKMTRHELMEEFVQAMCHARNIVATYSWADWVRVNPALPRVHCTKVGKDVELTIRLPTPAQVRSLQSMNEFVTHPPCMHVTLVGQCWEEGQWLVVTMPPVCCSVWRPEGVRIRDLLEIRDQVEQVQGGQPRGNEEIVATLMIYTHGSKPRDVEEERVRKMYYESPLPRYRKVTHGLDGKGVAAWRKDEGMYWDPGMEAVVSE